MGKLTLGATRFSSQTRMPLQTKAYSANGKLDYSLGEEAYQLVQVQYSDLRYPVIESINDVLRLRADKRLNAYRHVILEYSERLRSDLEMGNNNTLGQFKHDLQLATRDIAELGEWSRVSTFTYFISIPLAIVGAIIGIPLTDIILIPTEGLSRLFKSSITQESDWLLFGRS